MVSADMMMGMALLAGYFIGNGCSRICNLCILAFVVYILMKEAPPKRKCVECEGRYITSENQAVEKLGAAPAAPAAVKTTVPTAVTTVCPIYDVPATAGVEGYLVATALTQTPGEVQNRVDVNTSPTALAAKRTEFYETVVSKEALQPPQNPGLYTLDALS